MAAIRSLLCFWSCSAVAPLPPSAALPLRTLTGGLCRWCFAAADRDPGAGGDADKPGRHDALRRLKPLADHGLRLVLFLHGNRPHRDGIVILYDKNAGAVG